MLEATAEAQQSIDYLTDQLEKTQVVALEQVFYALIEEQMKTIMLANSRAEYLFKTIDPAIVPEIKSRPSRMLICVFGTLLGGMLGVLGVLIWRSASRYFRAIVFVSPPPKKLISCAFVLHCGSFAPVN